MKLKTDPTLDVFSATSESTPRFDADDDSDITLFQTHFNPMNSEAASCSAVKIINKSCLWPLISHLKPLKVLVLDYLRERTRARPRWLYQIQAVVVWRHAVFCVQDGRDGAVAAAESGHPGADCCGHSGHHEGLQGKLPSHLSLYFQYWRQVCQLVYRHGTSSPTNHDAAGLAGRLTTPLVDVWLIFFKKSVIFGQQQANPGCRQKPLLLLVSV